MLKPLACTLISGVLLSGCHMYGGQQVQETHYKVIAKKVSTKHHGHPKPGIAHSHPANHYTTVVHHSHANGGNPHKHHYGKAAPKRPSKAVFHVKVVAKHKYH
ncbi:MAG: hypothetical protein ACPG47_03015 [Leucothrix sp.]